MLTQSQAILESLEERYPDPPLLLPDVMGRAIVRSMVGIICCDIHPLNNLRVLKALRSELGRILKLSRPGLPAGLPRAWSRWKR